MFIDQVSCNQDQVGIQVVDFSCQLFVKRPEPFFKMQVRQQKDFHRFPAVLFPKEEAPDLEKVFLQGPGICQQESGTKANLNRKQFHGGSTLSSVPALPVENYGGPVSAPFQPDKI